MKFSGNYLTFLEYLNLGGTLKQTPFNLLEFEARKKIDVLTQNRLKNAETIPQEVKICEFNIIEKLVEYLDTQSGGKSSESVGSYSVSFKDIKQVIKEKNSEIEEIILDDLYGVIYNNEHIIYRGGNK